MQQFIVKYDEAVLSKVSSVNKQYSFQNYFLLLCVRHPLMGTGLISLHLPLWLKGIQVWEATALNTMLHLNSKEMYHH